jgi:prepilin peptidase CpaA
MLAVTTTQALWFLPFVLPICVYVAWSDMKFMRIPNTSVLSLVAVFAVMGVLALPLAEYAGRWLHLAVLLLIGFGVSSAGLVGAGDAKFVAAMGLFVARTDALLVLVLFSAVLLGAFATHRLARAVPGVRGMTPDWESWTRARDFPMGLALSGTLLIYLLLPFLLAR